MLAAVAAILFIVALIVHGSVSGWVFWALLGLLALALHEVYPYTPYYRRR